MSSPVSEANVGDLPAKTKSPRVKMPDATTWLGMTSSEVIPSERSERRGSTCITSDPRRPFGPGDDEEGQCVAGHDILRCPSPLKSN